ncbi:hypothetical protein [Robbsia sp. KACC 23696]|uniref:hypothetical protein n=1 Tax=Robbsia sp. KACC 23696 TaxID=3149231 RepID=UPI00325B5683
MSQILSSLALICQGLSPQQHHRAKKAFRELRRHHPLFYRDYFVCSGVSMRPVDTATLYFYSSPGGRMAACRSRSARMTFKVRQSRAFFDIKERERSLFLKPIKESALKKMRAPTASVLRRVADSRHCVDALPDAMAWYRAYSGPLGQIPAKKFR